MIDGFLEAVTGAGLPAVSPPKDLSKLDELEAAIAPLEVPWPVRRFWQRVDPSTLRAITRPCLHGPDLALYSWLMTRDEFVGLQPTALLPIAYSYQQCMGVELDQPAIQGGALFEWDLDDSAFERRFNDLQSWLTYVTDLLTTGRYRAENPPHGRQLLIPSPEDSEIEPQWRPALPPHPCYGTLATIDRDILEWPQHWQRVAGLTPESVQPRGATHTIAALSRTNPAQEVHATIVAKVVSLMGVGGETTVRVDDGTGLLVVHCPAKTTLLGPVLTDWFEFDIVVPAGPARSRWIPTRLRWMNPTPSGDSKRSFSLNTLSLPERPPGPSGARRIRRATPRSTTPATGQL